MTPTQLIQFQKEITRQIVNPKLLISLETLHRPREQGGFGLLDLRRHLHGLYSSWFIDILNSSSESFALHVRALLQNECDERRLQYCQYRYNNPNISYEFF